MLAYLLLRLIHVFHSLLILVVSFWKLLTHKPPLPLASPRRRIPKHLAILFTKDSPIDSNAEKERLLEAVNTILGWCRVVGIEQVSFYDKAGQLASCSEQIADRLHLVYDDGETNRDDTLGLKYPLTPPMSDYSDSRPLSPVNDLEEEDSVIVMHSDDPLTKTDSKDLPLPGLRSRQHTKPYEVDPAALTVYILSPKSSKAAIASAARTLRASHKANTKGEFTLSVDKLASLLEGQGGFPPPDFMIVYPLSPSTYHRAPLEMHEFPPWHIRLTEIYLNRYHKRHRHWLVRMFSSSRRSSKTSLPLTELEFRQALDEFSGAEMRFGK